jgi:hypothetical protein
MVFSGMIKWQRLSLSSSSISSPCPRSCLPSHDGSQAIASVLCQRDPQGCSNKVPAGAEAALRSSHDTRKLKHYFLAHKVWIVSDRSLARVLQSKEATGQITQWAMGISQYGVEFVSRWTIKSQALADFIAEWTDLGLRGIDKLPDHWVCTSMDPTLLKEQGLMSCSFPLKVIS